MPRALFIAYDFPPCPNIGGSLRSEKFVKYLPEFGWETSVVSLAGEPIANELYPNVHRIASLTPWARPYQLTPYGWPLPALRAARRVLDETPHQLIYVSCPPFAHIAAMARLKQQTGLPLVLDFRDAWSLDPYMEGSRLKKLLYRHWFPRQESRLIAKADLLLLNTPSALRGYLARYPELAGRVRLLPNGFDEHDFTDLPSVTANPDTPLTLLYSGRFGIGGRDPRPILDAIDRLRREGIHIQLRVLGHNPPGFALAVAERRLADRVKLLPQLPHRQALEELARAHVLLLYQEASTAPVSAVAGKTHEYLRSGKPILAIAPAGDNLRLIERVAGFSHCLTHPEPAAIADALRRLHELHLSGRLPRVSAAKPHYLRHYERRQLTSRLARAFDRLIERQD